MYHTQRALSKAQAIPFIGPVVFSPIKFVVGFVQVISGVAVSVFAMLGAIISQSELFDDMGTAAFGHILMGSLGMGYSAANMASWGLLGLLIEVGCCGDENLAGC